MLPSLSPTTEGHVTETTSPTTVATTFSPTTFPTRQPTSSSPTSRPSDSNTEADDDPFPIGQGTWQLRSRIDQDFAGVAMLRLSADGNIMALPAATYGDSSLLDGLARVLKWNNVESSWDTLGSPIPTGVPDFWSTIGMSSDGLSFIVGAGRVQAFEYIQNVADWQPLGSFSPPNADSSCELTGAGVAMSGDGRRVIVASPSRCDALIEERVAAQVYDLADNVWTPASLPIFIPSGFDASRPIASPAISDDGSTIAISFTSDDFTDSATWVYIQGPGGVWSETNIINTEIGEYSSRGIAFSTDGSRVAVAAKRIENGAAYVQVQEEGDGFEWTAVGEDIFYDDECCPWYTYENSVALSRDGNVLIFGNQGYGSDGDTAFRGSARVYAWNGSEWVSIGALYGDPNTSPPNYQETWFGLTTDISANGQTIAVGAPSKGYIEIYDYVI